MNIRLFPSLDITMLPWMFLYIYYIACVLVHLYGKFLEVELLVEIIYAFKIVMNIAKLFPLDKRSTHTHSQPQWKRTWYISERLCIRDEKWGKYKNQTVA